MFEYKEELDTSAKRDSSKHGSLSVMRMKTGCNEIRWFRMVAGRNVDKLGKGLHLK